MILWCLTKVEMEDCSMGVELTEEQTATEEPEEEDDQENETFKVCK